MSTFSVAAKHGSQKICRLLLEAETLPSNAVKLGLRAACSAGQLPTVLMLLNHKANPNADGVRRFRFG
jgi:hypothetical protein